MLSSLQPHTPYVGGFASGYAGGFPGFQPFPTFQPYHAFANFPPMPPIPLGGYGAGATASIGSGMKHQTAFLTPENPVSFLNRFKTKIFRFLWYQLPFFNRFFFSYQSN